MAKVYLAGPINGCTDEECNDWRTFVKELLGFASLEFVDPMRRDYRGREGDFTDEIVEGDLADINQCDYMIASCPKPSVGTSMEVFYQSQRVDDHLDVCPPLVVHPKDQPVSPWLAYHSHVFHSYEEAVDWVVSHARG